MVTQKDFMITTILFFYLFFAIIILAATLFNWWMIIDCVINQKKDKLVWMLILIFLHFIGALIYLFMVKLPRFDGKPLTIDNCLSYDRFNRNE